MRPAHIAVAVPIVTLGAAYAWLAVEVGRPWIGGAIVHESGRYDFLETAFYVGHFLREAPVAVAYALFAVAAAGGGGAASGYDRRRATLALGAAGALLLGAFAAAAVADGTASAAIDLSQGRTRDDLTAPGSHWRFHLLATVWAGVAAPIVAWGIGARPAGARLAGIAWGWVALATLVFGVSGDVVADPRYVGHQAREIATAGLLHLPLAVGLVAWLAGPDRPVRERPSRIRFALAAAIPIYLGAATLALDAMDAAHEAPLAALVAAHAWEHALDVVFCGLLAVGLLGPLGTRPGVRDA